MVALHERLRRLEEARIAVAEDLSIGTEQRLRRWPETILDRYVEGRLDELAATNEPIRKLLAGLAAEGYATQDGGSWHPLYAVDDEHLNTAVLKRLNEIASFSTPAN